MKKSILITCTIISSAFLLTGCANSFHEKKAPCPPTAGLFSNPCNPLPINIAKAATSEKLS